MRIFYLAIITVFLAASCSPTGEHNASSGVEDSTNNTPADSLPVMVFKTDKHDFGSIKEGEKATHIFTFKNEGKSDLVISNAQGSCGCTVPEYPKTPITPGSEGSIKVTFDSHGKPGMNKKEVLVTTNCKPSTKILQIQVNVEPVK